MSVQCKIQYGLSYIRQCLLRVVYLCWMIACFSVVSHAMPLAGVEIENRASAVFFDAEQGLDVKIDSNIVRVRVASVLSASLSAGQTLTLPVGTTVLLPHSITNMGNIPYSFTLSANNVDGDQFDFNQFKIYIDLNQDGIPNGSDYLLLADGILPSLAVGATLNVIIETKVPQINGDVQGNIYLRLQDDDDRVQADAFDNVKIASDGIVRLTKSASAQKISHTEQIIFTLQGSNTSNSVIRPVQVTIDGNATQKVLVVDAIPVNTLFDGIIQQGASQPLYHVVGESANSYRTTPPADLRYLDKVAFAFDQINSLQFIQVAFAVRANQIYAGDLTNIAQVLQQYEGNTEVSIDSNRVDIAVVQAQSAEIRFYQNAQYQQIAPVAHAGKPLYLQAPAALCNRDASVIESYPIRLSAARSGDIDTTYQAVESAPNSGVFVIEPVRTAFWPTVPVALDNHQIEAGYNDRIHAVLTCGGTQVEAFILVDPAGVVFDSGTNAPISGAVVTLLGVNPDGSSFTPVVFAEDAETRLSNIVTTGMDGLYHFPLVMVGKYKLQIVPPEGFGYPTEVPFTVLNTRFPERRLDEKGSKGGDFAVTIEGPVFIDVPMDVRHIKGLLIEKKASVSTAQIGDVIEYTLILRNQHPSVNLSSVKVQDQLPEGLAYIQGSAYLDDALIADPVDGNNQPTSGSRLIFKLLQNLTAGQKLTLRYRVQVRAGAVFGQALNTAQMVSTQGESNIASAAVQIQGGVFADEAYLFGKVFLDCNANRQQDAGELGVPAIRLYLEDGSFLVTDNEGKYSLYGLSPRTHVLKLDELSLPTGAKVLLQDSRNALRSGSRFVDAKRGEWHRGDFPLSCNEAIVQQVEARRGKVNTDAAFTATLQAARERKFEPTVLGDLKTRPAEGVVLSSGQLSTKPIDGLVVPTPNPDILLQEAKQGFDRIPLPVRPDVSLDVDTLIEGFDPALDFLELKNADRLATDTLSIRVKGAYETKLRLFVNGEVLDEKRVGRTTGLKDKNIQVWEYIGVKLPVGKNTLKLIQVDNFGITRGDKSIEVWVPGALSHLEVSVPNGQFVADGVTPVPVLVRLKDAEGSLITAKTLLTLESAAGRWDIPDLNPVEPNVQTYIEGGEAIFDLIPPNQAGKVEINIITGVLEHKEQLSLLPNLRPMVAVGVIEGALSLSQTGHVEALTPTDSFEQEIRQLSSANGKAGVRGAFYLKGKVKGEYLLTMAYDSDKDTKTRLFRDIQPDQFYPIYGDSAERGFDAQSTSKLFVRVDKGQSWIMYGDYSTSTRASTLPLSTLPVQQLGNYSRSLTGVRGHVQYDRVAINYFAAHDNSTQKVVEIPAQGLSIYTTNFVGMKEGSQKVEVITYDKNQNSVILNTALKTPFTDYNLNIFANTLTFAETIPSFDAEGNPLVIRIAYEVDEGGEAFWVVGFDGDVQITEKLLVGVGMVFDQEPNKERNLFSAHLGAKLTDKSQLVLEAAQTNSALQDKMGHAVRAEYRYDDQTWKSRIFAQYATHSFDNPNAGVTPDKLDMGAQLSGKVSSTTQLTVEASHSQDKKTDAQQQQLFVTVDQKVGDSVNVRAGVRYQQDKDPAATSALNDKNTTSLLAKLTYQPKWLPQANAYFEYEQDIADTQRKIVALGGEFFVANRARFYARHAFTHTLNILNNTSSTASGNSQTLYGVDYAYMKNGKLYTEYALSDTINQKDASVKFGVRNTWLWQAGLGGSATFERVTPVGTSATKASIAATLGLEYTSNPIWKAAARLEWQETDDASTWYNSLALARKLDQNWTMLASNNIRLRLNRLIDAKHVENSLKFGLAYRPVDHNRLNALLRYEYNLDRDAEQAQYTAAHVLSSHANYQFKPYWVLSGRYAFRWANTELAGLNYHSQTHLLYARNTFDISDRFNTGLAASTRWGDGSQRYMLGLEAGAILSPQVWLALGYNLTGFEDKVLNADEYMARGLYLRLRIKFDENSLRWLQ